MNLAWVDVRKAISGFLLDKGLRGLSELVAKHPRMRPEAFGVDVVKNVAFGTRGERLDVYRPRDLKAGAIPVLYLHGGGFRILSKDTHWAMALSFARHTGAHGQRYVVFVPNYRLAPANPFPAAIEDAVEALLWVLAHASEYGADPSQLVLAGESAGGNLSVALTIARSWERPEPYARQVFEANPTIRAVLPACGYLHVSEAEHRGTPEGWSLDRIRTVSSAYLPGGRRHDGTTDLADVLPFLESAPAPARPLPPMFAVVGGADPVLADTERLSPAWARHGAAGRHEVYPGGPHAFHAFVWTPNARAAWRDQHAFLDSVFG